MYSNILNEQDFLFFIIILVLSISFLIITRKLLKVSFPFFFMGLIGLVIGLTVGSLAASPLSRLPGEYGRWLPIIVDVLVTVAVLDLFLAQAKPLTILFGKLFNRISEGKETEIGEIIVDTSVLIDGRIEEISRTGFILGKIIIPQFVLNELQNVADSDDPLKRAKGRKGLEVLDHLQHDQSIKTSILDELTNSKEPVDSKLIRIAKARNSLILTVDYNLNKVAKIQKIEVLNINELAEAIKPVLIPGENILVKVIQAGKEANQGVGYLNDGTMIVVESGDKFIGQEIECEVVRIFQTVAGKMVFVQPKKKQHRSRQKS